MVIIRSNTGTCNAFPVWNQATRGWTGSAVGGNERDWML